MRSGGIFTAVLFLSMPVILNGQDYLISFEAMGSASSITSIKVENVTQVKHIILNGDEQLRLWGGATAVLEYPGSLSKEISFMPNPVKDHSRMRFSLPSPGETEISIHDLSGKEIYKSGYFLTAGEHTFLIENLAKGIHVVRIKSGNYSLSGRMICSGQGKGRVKLLYETSTSAGNKIAENKGTAGEVIMQYNAGDILKFTGTSGEYSTVVTLVPVSDKTVSFNFIACKDGSGNTYPVVNIGSAKGEPVNYGPGEEKGVQIWMAENLKTSIFNDGTAISNVTGGAAWSTSTGPAWCWYNNTPGDYGMLYNWHAVETKKLCPAGFRVPTDEEWQALVQYLGGAMAAGGKLKETGNAHWADPNSGATNSSGFSAFGGGWRNAADGSFTELQSSGYYWTSTMVNITNACYRCMLSSGSAIYGYMSEVDQKFGFSVRCIKEN
ncbi:MAG TPA: FISUMP domain-containing protein [Bacteroidales bacterium]|nr:FISUMP domain-containing protein [Bacteroidales bacterium]HPJ60207.1 FISUMP domain-containing protein [Bacteroidales bacterium]HPR12277.1 FISUMP domain-containing protein [Bacteroidales bacterium]